MAVSRFRDVLGKRVGIGEVVGPYQAFLAEPENVQPNFGCPRL